MSDRPEWDRGTFVQEFRATTADVPRKDAPTVQSVQKAIDARAVRVCWPHRFAQSGGIEGAK